MTYAVSASRAGTRSVIMDGAQVGSTQAVSDVGIVKNWAFVPAPPNYVDFAGNIGSVSLYGKALYGQKLYSQGGAFAPVLSADITLVGQQFFAGNLAPVVTFSGKVGFDFQLVGGIAPTVTFAGNFVLNEVLTGSLVPQVTFSADLTLTVTLQASLTGRLDPIVSFGASSMISGPLWGETAPCPPPLWTPSEPCDSVEWQEAELCNG